MMEKENEVLGKILDALCEKNPTEEQKLICALVKKALFADSLLTFIDEVSKAFDGKGKVGTDSVKNAIEFAKANNEVQIRNLSISDKEKDERVKQEADRLKVVEVWILGTLAHFELLKYRNRINRKEIRYGHKNYVHLCPMGLAQVFRTA